MLLTSYWQYKDFGRKKLVKTAKERRKKEHQEVYKLEKKIAKLDKNSEKPRNYVKVNQLQRKTKKKDNPQRKCKSINKICKIT